MKIKSVVIALLFLAACGTAEKEEKKEITATPEELLAERQRLEKEQIEEVVKKWQDTKKKKRDDYKNVVAAKRRRELPVMVKAVASRLAKNSKDITAMNALAMSHFRQGQFDMAKVILQRALNSDPNNPGLLNNKALILLREAKTAQAVALLRGVFVQSKKKGLESLLENQTPIENLAGLYLRHRDYKNAAPVCREL